ncbi:MAG: thymidylate synthase [Firmicutes bacterium]|nr:thymidylate synthase [Bacillota bacterium]
MANFDEQYIALCEKIISEGHTIGSERTGVGTRKLFGQTLRFDLSKEFPILTSKFVGWKSAILEMLWIYQEQSNDVRWLKDRGIKIWDGWAADENGVYKQVGGKAGMADLSKGAKKQDGGRELKLGSEYAHTIGTAYGWIVKQYGLTDRLLNVLKTNPQDRRMIMSLWQEEYLATACLPSCAWNTQWCVTGKKLNVTLNIRSSDVALGLPYNVTQYATLAHLLAQSTGHEVGEMLVVLNDAHLYSNQIEGIKEQIRVYREKGCPPPPKFWINPKIKDFYKFDNTKELKDIKIMDYEYNMKISFPVSV